MGWKISIEGISFFPFFFFAALLLGGLGSCVRRRRQTNPTQAEAQEAVDDETLCQ